MAEDTTNNGAKIGFTRTHRSKRWLWALAAAVVLIAVAAGALWFWHAHQTQPQKPLTPRQRAIHNSIGDERQFVQGQDASHAPDSAKALSYGNLAQSYALAGQCDKADAALAQARKLGGAKLQPTIDRVESAVKEKCK